MIYKVITTFPCGNKIIVTVKQGLTWYACGLKLNSKRPNLIQIFTKDTNEYDLKESRKALNMVVNKISGQVTLNGEYVIDV